MTKKIKYKKEDPFRDRESERYENPIPSREFILELIVETGTSMTRKEIARAFSLSEPEALEALRRRLNAMIRDCQICMADKGYAPLTILKEETGVLRIERDGFGSVKCSETTVRLPPREIRGLFEGDTLHIRITRYDHDGRALGELVDLIEKAPVKILGRFFKEGEGEFVMPLGRKYAQDIQIPSGMYHKAVEGDIVQVAINREKTTAQATFGTIDHILGDPEREGIEIEVAILKFQLPNTWSEAVLEQARSFGVSIPISEKANRIDLTELPFVTIDGEDAKDFDDAVYAEARSGGGWKLYVAIADVSHYVTPGSPLENEAKIRGTSVYFPGHVIPMLPEALSNGLCSLVPNQDRLALVCEMLFSKAGEITRSKLYPATIQSKARLTYTLVSKILEGDARQAKKYADLVPHLKHLDALYEELIRARTVRGAIDFDSVETQIMFDESGKIASILPRERTKAHRIIEECMLAANVSSAKFLKKSKIPTLYRVHMPPPEEKLKALRDFLSELGLGLKGGDTPTPKDFSELIESIQGREDASIIQTVMLRSMSQAEYSPAEDGHFGLAYSAYLHFTSPIRRYPDLLVHRQIKSVLSGSSKDSWPDLAKLGEQCSQAERRADEATRDAVSSLKCHYMKEKIGEKFMGKVTAVTSFGLFVELENYYVEGLIHVAALGDDYFIFEPFKHRMIGERTRKVYQLGDTLEVTLMRVDVDDKKIDLEIYSDQPKSTKAPEPRRGRSRSKKSKSRKEVPAKGVETKGPAKSKKKRRKKK